MNFPPEASSAVHVNTPAPEHILAERMFKQFPSFNTWSRALAPRLSRIHTTELPSQRGVLVPSTSWCWHTRLPCLPYILWQWLAVSYRSEGRMSNCCSLDLSMYLQSDDSLFPPRLQMTADAAANLVATSSPQDSVESLGNGLLCDHWQADLLSGRLEWHWGFPQRVLLNKPYK